MSDWKAALVAAVKSGTPPTYEELDKALSGAMADIEMYEGMVAGMSQWLSKFVVAYQYQRHDEAALTNVFDAFIKTHVKEVHASQGGLH
jgi:hypothetical protein